MPPAYCHAHRPLITIALLHSPLKFSFFPELVIKNRPGQANLLTRKRRGGSEYSKIMRMITEIAYTIDVNLKIEYDCPSKNQEGKVPNLNG